MKVRRNAKWIVREYIKGNMVDFNGKSVKPLKVQSTSIYNQIVNMYDYGELIHVNDLKKK